MHFIAEKLPRARLHIGLCTLIGCLAKLPFARTERGKTAKAFEMAMAEIWEVKHCIALSSCRMCLFYVLKALGLSKGDEVILTPLTIPDIVNAIHVLGLRPVFVDMSLDGYNIDIDDLARKISKNSKVLLVTYLCGIVPDMNPILEIVRKHGLLLVEDISQNYGATHNGKLLGTYGIAAVGSLSMTKTISSLGGGIILTRDDKLNRTIRDRLKKELCKPSKRFLLKEAIRQIKIALATSRLVFSWIVYYIFRAYQVVSPKGFASMLRGKKGHVNPLTCSYYENVPVLRDHMPEDAFISFSDLQAEIALSTVEKLSWSNDRRKELAKVLYREIDEKTRRALPARIADFENNVYWHFPILVGDHRDGFQRHLLKKGFDSTGYALRLCSEEPAFTCYRQDTPTARFIKGKAVFLPIHEHEMFSEEKMAALAGAVNSFFENRGPKCEEHG